MRHLAILSLISILCFSGLSAQQTPLLQQSALMPQLDNPARYGQGFVGLNYRQQWMDLEGNDSPTTIRLALDASHWLGDPDKRYGLGIGITHDRVQIVQRNQVDLAFAYHLVPGTVHQLSAGVTASWASLRLDFDQTLRLNNPDDLALFEAGAQSAGSFQGGPGLFYQFNPAEGHFLTADVVLPQLFASDLNYEAGPTYDLLPQVLTRVAYRYEGGGVGFEPILVYRRLCQSCEEQTGTIDALLRISFLEGRFFVSGGTRFNAQGTHFSFGVKPLPDQKTLISGTLELNQLFGPTLEIGLFHDFSAISSATNSSSTRDRTRTSRTVRSSREIRRLIAAAEESIADQLATARPALNAGRTSLEGVIGQEVPELARKERLQFAKGKLAIGESALRVIRNKINQLESLPSTQSNPELITAINRFERQYDDLANEVRSLSDLINKVDLANILATYIREGRAIELQQALQEQLGRQPNLPLTLEEVRVEDRLREMRVYYRFSNTQEAYYLPGEELARLKSLTGLLSNNLISLRDNGITIEGIVLEAQMLYPQIRWRQFDGGEYRGEYGPLPIVNWTVIDQSNTPASARQDSVSIHQGPIKQHELVALKLLGLANEFESRIPGVSITYLISGPHDQATEQEFLIELVLGK